MGVAHSIAAFWLLPVWWAGIGGVLLTLLFPRRSAPWLLTPVIGLALVGLASTWSFTFGIPLTAIAAASVIVSGIGWLLMTARGLSATGRMRVPWERWRDVVPGVAITGVTGWLLLLPVLVGGRQFTVFQGNQWDHFNYLTSASVFARLSRAEIAQAWVTPADLLADPLLAQARMAIATRPMVFLMYTTSALVMRLPFADGAAVWLASLALILVVTTAFLVRTLFGPRRAWLRWLAPALVVSGFWGQYLVDINAWSQLAAMSVVTGILALTIGLCLSTPTGTGGSDRPPVPVVGEGRGVSAALLIGILGACLFSLYPEILGLTGLLVLAALVPVVRIRSWSAVTRWWPLLLAAAVALALAVLDWQNTIGFLRGQLGFALATQETYWQYFDAYLLGRDQWYLGVLADLVTPSGVPLSPAEGVAVLGDRLSVPVFIGYALTTLASIGIGLLGLYFLTPPLWQGLPGVLGVTISIGAFLLAVAVLLIAARRGSLGTRILVSVSAAGMVPVVLLAVNGQLFAAGKALASISLLLSLALVTPLIDPQLARWPWLLAIAAAWLALQLAFALTRIPGAGADDGIHRAPPYPAIQQPALKAAVDWNSDRAIAAARRCEAVTVELTNPWLRHDTMVRLRDAGVRYRITDPVNTYYGVGADVGVMPPIEADCQVAAVVDERGRQQVVLMPIN